MLDEERRTARHQARSSSGGLRLVTGLGGAIVLAAVAVATLLYALFGPDATLSLLDQSFIAAVIVVASLGLLIGVAGRPWRWWSTWGVGIGVAAALIVVIVWWWLGRSALVDEHYPPSFLAWAWGSFVALGVAVTGWWSGGAAVRVVRFVTVPIILFGSFLLINVHYGYWPTMGDLLDRPLAGQVSGPGGLSSALNQPNSGPDGKYGAVSIPSPAGFNGGPAWAWIPPAYDRVNRADLPVLLMLPGWPGNSANWARAGQVLPLANAWARAHHGIAPVMVFVSGNGAADNDTECVNGTQGPAETYLTQDVPNFITHVLGISIDPARWGTVGFSEGGTCALELATKDPSLFGRFIDISGELVPSYGPDGDAAVTLKDLFAGDATTMLHDEPLWLMAHHRYPHSEGWFAAGDGDQYHERIAARLTAAASAAGMKAFDDSGGSGGHSWSYARAVFDSLYPAFVKSMPTVKGPASATTNKSSVPTPQQPHHGKHHEHRQSAASRRRLRRCERDLTGPKARAGSRAATRTRLDCRSTTKPF